MSRTGAVRAVRGFSARPAPDARLYRAGLHTNPERQLRIYSWAHRGWSRAREIFGPCGQAAGAGYTRLRCGVQGPCGLLAGLDSGGLPVTPAGLWDLSPFYSLAPGPDL